MPHVANKSTDPWPSLYSVHSALWPHDVHEVVANEWWAMPFRD